MSLFPKRTYRGGKVNLHYSLGYRGVSRPIFIECYIIDPSKRIVNLFSKFHSYFPNYDHEKVNYPNDKKLFDGGNSSMIYAKFFENISGNNKLSNIYQRFNSAMHNYYKINIKSDFDLGKYYVKMNFYIDGKLLNSFSEKNDFFLVEKLNVIKDNENIQIVNESPERSSFRIYLSEGSDTNAKNLLFDVDGFSELLLPKKYNFKNAFLIYADNQKIIPLNNDVYVFRNPKVSFFSDLNRTVLKYDDEYCYMLQGEIRQFWCDLIGFQSKEVLLKSYSLEIYESLLANDLISEIEFNEDCHHQ